MDFKKKVARGEIIKLFPLSICNRNLEEDMIRSEEYQKNIKQLKKSKAICGYVFVFFVSVLILMLFGLSKVHAQFNPKDVSDLMFFVESTNLSTSHHIATCESNFCLNHSNTEGAIITEQYCDVTNDCSEGCVRRWIDQSNYTQNSVGDPPIFNPPEYTNGRNFGQDDSVKPCYINDCINGKPCVRGGGGVAYATDYSAQDKYLEIQIKDFVYLTGEFSIFLLAKPIAQTEDWDYFGQSVSYFRHRVADNYLQLRVPGNSVWRVTPNNSVTLNTWQLIEVHRDASNKITIYINGIDKTNSSNINLAGTFTIGYLLSAFKTNAKTGEEKSMHGDVAAFLIYNKKTSSIENNDIREYFDTNYLGNVLSVKNDKISNKIDVFPNPMTDEVTIKVNNTDENFYENETPIIYDVLGKKIKTEILKKETKNTIEYSIHLNTNLNKGIYFLSLRGNSIKLVKN